MKTLAQAIPDAGPGDLPELEDLFPQVDCPYVPAGPYCVVQDRTASLKTKGGVWKPETVRETDAYQENLGRIIAMGATVGYDKDSLDWTDGADRLLPGWPWYEIGDVILLSRLSTTRETIKKLDNDREVNVRIVHFGDIMATVRLVAKVLYR